MCGRISFSRTDRGSRQERLTKGLQSKVSSTLQKGNRREGYQWGVVEMGVLFNGP